MDSVNHLIDALPIQDHARSNWEGLWHACAGPHVYIPQAGEKVFYFPQGHMEQVDGCVTGYGGMDMPIFDLPPMILCRIINVQLKVEPETDEVFAQMTLLVQTEKDEMNLDELREHPPFSQRANGMYFSKKLTPSDMSVHGGLSIPRQYAEQIFPPLDMSRQPPQQQLIATDLLGNEWNFRHIYRGQPRRHLITSGWSTFLVSKKPASGDAVVFLRGENGQPFVGICREIKSQNNEPRDPITVHSLKHELLVQAIQAVNEQSLFTFNYYAWRSPSNFIIPYHRYLRSAGTNYFVGAKVRMLVEGQGYIGPRPHATEGTVVGVEEIDHIRWPNSRWRTLNVRWDAGPSVFEHPERVSPWDVEPTEPL